MVSATGERHIQGWKEIAARIGRDERTAKRWEKQRGLPVRRIPGGGRANVYLIEAELETWLLRTPAPEPGLPEAPSADRSAAQHSAPPPAPQPDLSAKTGVETSVSAAARPEPTIRGNRIVWSIAAAVVATVLAAGGAWYAYQMRSATGNVARAAADRARRSSSPEVDQLYLQAVYLSEARTADSLRAAHSLFGKAIAADPRFAPAHSGLAVTFLLLREYATMPSPEAYTRARESAERALALDPGMADAHAVLGFIDFFSLWRAAEAAREFQTAIRLDANNSMAHHWYGSMLMHEGRFAEALDQLDVAQHLNPTSNAILSTRALTLGYGGRREEALQLLQALIRSDPTAPGPHRNLAYLSLMQPEDSARFMHEMLLFAEMQQDPVLLRCLRAGESARQRGGTSAMWTELADQQRSLPTGAHNFAMLTAEAESALGHRDAALEQLRLLTQQRDGSVLGIVISPVLLPLHGDPRFRQIAEMLGLEADPAPLPPSGRPATLPLEARSAN